MGCGISSKPVSSTEPIDLQLNASINVQLDKWNSREITLVRSRFKKALKRPRQLTVDHTDFYLVFPKLYYLHEQVSLNAFHLFDQDASSDIDFKEFCYVLTTLVYGTIEEQKNFVFRLFDLDRNGDIMMEELKIALISFMMIKNKIEQKQITEDLIKDSAVKVEQILKHKKMLNEEGFIKTMEKFIPLSSVLEIFEVIPSPITEFKTIKSISIKARQDKSQKTCRIISYKWWGMWYDFIKLHNKIESSPTQSFTQEDFWLFYTTDKKSIISVSKGNSNKNNKVEKPGEINNIELEGPIKGTLKDGLKFMRDYVTIPNEAWEYFHEWYGGGPEFERAIIEIPKGKHIVELYPPVLYITRTNGEATADSYVPFTVSKTFKMEEVMKLAKEKFGKKNLECRLWYRYMLSNNKWELVKDLNATVEELRIGCSDKLILENKTINGWPMDRLAKNESQWKEGDKIDIYIDKEWKEGTIIKNIATNLQVKVEDNKSIPVERNSTMIAPYKTHTIHSFQKTPDTNAKLKNEFKSLENLGNT